MKLMLVKIFVCVTFLIFRVKMKQLGIAYTVVKQKTGAVTI